MTIAAKRALLAIYKAAGGRPGTMVPHDVIAQELEWTKAQVMAAVLTIPLAYVVDTYGGSSLTPAGRDLAEELLRQAESP